MNLLKLLSWGLKLHALLWRQALTEASTVSCSAHSSAAATNGEQIEVKVSILLEGAGGDFTPDSR